MREKLKKYDKAILGVVAGTVFTILGFILGYFVIIKGMTFSEYIHYTVNGPERQNIMIFCMLLNMFLFYLTNFRWNLNEFTKGLVAVTLLLGIMLVILTVM